jgi:hypothetical protein
MTSAIRDRTPETLIAEERTARHPVMLVSFDISFDDDAVETAIEAAVQANSELMICLAVTLPVANANAAARRTMGNPVVREEIREIMIRARAAGANPRQLVYNTPRPLSATIDITRTRPIGLLVFGPSRRIYGRLRFRLHLRRLRRKANCLVWPLE